VAQKIEQERLAHEKVSAWCKARGFYDMVSKKKSFLSGSRFPLHEAVTQRDEEIVGLLVELGVDRAALNSKGQTAKELASKMNKHGSMNTIIAKLR